MSIIEKVKWILTKITGKSRRIRTKIDAKNTSRYDLACLEAELDGECEIHYKMMEYPLWAIEEPKMEIMIEGAPQSTEITDLSKQIKNL